MTYIELDKLPSVIENNTFDDDGFVETDAGLMVPVYVASQMGFSESGQMTLDWFYELLKESKILPLCPFKACGEYVDIKKLTDDTLTVKENKAAWQNFNDHVGPVNFETLMPCSKFMIALLDGGHALDDGVSAEIGYYAPVHKQSIVGVRTDIRFAENISAPINPAVRWFLDKGPYKGELFNGPNAYELALKYVNILANDIIEEAGWDNQYHR